MEKIQPAAGADQIKDRHKINKKATKRAVGGITGKVFLYLSAFVAFIVVLLWLLQIVFISDIYESIKMKAMISAADVIEANIESPEFDVLALRVAQENNICMLIYEINGSRAPRKLSVEILADCYVHNAFSGDMNILYNRALKNGGSYTKHVRRSGFRNVYYDPHSFIGDPPAADTGLEDSTVYCRIITTHGGQEIFMLLNTVISPDTATINTLRLQSAIIVCAIFLAAVLLSVYVSRKIARPIVQINESAKKLARADYSASFEGGTYREISELSDTLNYAAAELSKVNALQRELIANVSHDLRTPLTMISGYSEVMRDIPGENTPENVQVIIDEAAHLTALVNDMLDLSKLKAGSAEPKPERLNLTELIRATLERYAKLVEHNGYSIRLECGEDVYVLADRVRILQVLYNLVNNAINYAGEDKCVIVSQTVSGGVVRISVTDHGDGIEPEQLPLIWDRYYKVDRVHKRAAVGTGLGLSIVKGILDAHGAKYGAESTPGAGSTFWFELPTGQ